MIAVIDYGAGNLRSVTNALETLGVEHAVMHSWEAFFYPDRWLIMPDGVILPGVGHFGQMMHALYEKHFELPLFNLYLRDVPYLGICLGMQALYQASEEAPGVKGFGWFRGTVRRFPADPQHKVPHMGWSEVDGQSYYFANSYYVPADVKEVAATARHGIEFAAVVRKKNCWGVQFHPEKSGPAGLAFLKEWLAICRPRESSPAST